jgi:hypothetical protein
MLQVIVKEHVGITQLRREKKGRMYVLEYSLNMMTNSNRNFQIVMGTL